MYEPSLSTRAEPQLAQARLKFYSSPGHLLELLRTTRFICSLWDMAILNKWGHGYIEGHGKKYVLCSNRYLVVI